MNLFVTIPKAWRPGSTEALNEWFAKIHKSESFSFSEYREFLTELEKQIQ